MSGISGLALSACGSQQAVSPVTQPVYLVGGNRYTADATPQPGVQKRQVQSGETWKSLFGDRARLAQHLNRQNTGLRLGQTVLIPDAALTMSDISPFATKRQTGAGYRVIFDHNKNAWGLYLNGTLVRWGAAVGGKNTETTRGEFTISETAGPDRVSNLFPVRSATDRGGAPMPYFMRITSGGIGLHAGEFGGLHASEGCIRMFYEDAQWLNLNIARQHTVRVTVI